MAAYTSSSTSLCRRRIVRQRSPEFTSGMFQMFHIPKPIARTSRPYRHGVRFSAYGDWNLWCNTCDICACKVCVDLGRLGHRHAMVWTMVVRKNLTFQNNNIYNLQRSCDRCKQSYMGALFQGFECTVCRNYHVCAPCISKKKMLQHMICQGRNAAYELQLIRD